MKRIAVLLALSLAPVLASAAGTPPGDASPTVVTFDQDPTGQPPPSFEPVIGDWYVNDLAGARGLMVDGSRWRQGTPSANLADQARRLYGEKYAEFLDGVKAFAFFPLAVYEHDCPSDDLALSVRFYPQAGRIDQGAGLAWSIAPDGSYLGARANALEDNLLFFRVVRGKRTILDTVRGVQTTSRTWHTLNVTLHGRSLSVVLDGQERLHREIEAPPTGRCGLWSKADSQVLFDDFTVGKAIGRAPGES
jgi:hypothetical protein